ncbi:MAG: hypothetical protein ACXWT4_12545 [Methylobacter sp.]
MQRSEQAGRPYRANLFQSNLRIIVYHSVWEAIAFPLIYFQVLTENHTKTLHRYMMNLFKKAVITSVMAISFGASTVALAEDAKAAEVIAHIEEAIAEINKHDFNAAYIHEKAARNASDEIVGNEAAVKQGLDSLIKAQIIGKSADEPKAIAELNKALGFYKSINH